MKSNYKSFEDAVEAAKKCLCINDPIWYVRKYDDDDWYIESGKESGDESGEKIDLEDFITGDFSKDNEVAEQWDWKHFNKEADGPTYVQEIILWKLSNQEQEYAIVYNYGDGSEVLGYKGNWTEAYELFERECENLEDGLKNMDENQKDVEGWLNKNQNENN